LLVVSGNLEVATIQLGRGVKPSANIAAAMDACGKAAEMSGLMLTYLGESFRKHEALDLSEICRGSLDELKRLSPESVVLEVNLPANGPMIMGNADQILQILTNLTTNAAEAIGDGPGVIRLCVKSVGDVGTSAGHRFPLDSGAQSESYACLEVTDSGCGVGAGDIEKLFDPFFSSKSTGRGMGLAVVLGIARAHGGIVVVESEPSSGSVFRVYFPEANLVGE
jgi:signal transduction histidine kinase